MSAEAVDDAAMQEHVPAFVVLHDPAHAVTDLDGVRIHDAGEAFAADDDLRHVRLAERRRRHQALALPDAVSELQTQELRQVPRAGIDRPRRVRFLDLVPGNDVELALFVLAVRAGVVGRL